MNDPRLKTALAHQQARRFKEAEALYEQILSENPAQADALHFSGLLSFQRGQFDRAAELIGRAVALSPGTALFLENLGVVLGAQGKVNEAIAAFRKALEIQPTNPDIHQNLANALIRSGKTKDAVAEYQEAIKLKPSSADLHFQLANVFQQRSEFEESVAAYRQAIALQPRFVEAFNGLANVLRRQRRLDESIATCKEVLAIKPDYVEGYNSLGAALREVGQVDQAITAHRHALRLRPNDPETYNYLGNALALVGKKEEVIESYRQAIAIRPDHGLSHFNLGLMLLSLGDFKQGWREYEWHRQTKELGENKWGFSQPRWEGEDVRGRRILLVGEQGFGDTIQFCRYAAILNQRGAQVILQCQPPLVRLLQGLAGAERVIAWAQPVQDFDLHCPLLRVPMLLETTLETIPKAVPYVFADPKLVQNWQSRFDSNDRRLKVGLVWAGHRQYSNDHYRSVPAADMAPLLQTANVSWVSLQKGETSQQLPQTGSTVMDWTQELNDFADTAALIANLDLVITVDTAVAHLAGAMGKPTWIMLPAIPDWRWMLERSDSLWYPTMKLFRQERRGEWGKVIGSIANEIVGWARPTN